MAASLIGCSTSSTQLTADQLIPPALTSCADAPPVPARPATGGDRTDEQKAGYTADLHGAYADCKSTVTATKAQHDALSKQLAAPTGGFHLTNPFAKKPAS